MSSGKTKTGFLNILQVLLAVLIFAFPPLLLVCPQPAQAEEPEANESDVEYWAVVVGVSDYDLDELGRGNVSDAQDLYGELASIWGQDHVNLIVNEEATKRNIRDAICNWLDEREDLNDIVLFYFSGHGGDKYLYPYDTLDHKNTNDITSAELSEWLVLLESENIVVILDACFSGSFLPDISEKNRIILTSSSENQASLGSDQHGIFSYFILDAIKSYDFFGTFFADFNEDYEISIEEVFSYARSQVTEYTDMSQTPQKIDRNNGDVVLFFEAIVDIDPSDSSLIVKVDDMMCSSGHLPKIFKWLPNSSHCYQISSLSNEWLSSEVFNISQGGEYKLVYLDVESEYGNPQGEGWYVKGTTANVSVSSPVGMILRNVFSGWSFSSADTNTSTTVYMRGSKAVTAIWRKDYSQLYILVSGLVVIIAGGAFFFVRRRRKIRLMTTPAEVALPPVQQDESTKPQ